MHHPTQFSGIEYDLDRTAFYISPDHPIRQSLARAGTKTEGLLRLTRSREPILVVLTRAGKAHTHRYPGVADTVHEHHFRTSLPMVRFVGPFNEIRASVADHAPPIMTPDGLGDWMRPSLVRTVEAYVLAMAEPRPFEDFARHVSQVRLERYVRAMRHPLLERARDEGRLVEEHFAGGLYPAFTLREDQAGRFEDLMMLVLFFSGQRVMSAPDWQVMSSPVLQAMEGLFEGPDLTRPLRRQHPAALSYA